MKLDGIYTTTHVPYSPFLGGWGGVREKREDDICNILTCIQASWGLIFV